MLGPDWRKSTLSHENACVAVRHHAGRVELRHSNLGDASPIVSFTAGQWQQEVLDPIRRGEFEGADWAIFDPLRFTFAERDAFLADVRERDTFDLPAEAVAR